MLTLLFFGLLYFMYLICFKNIFNLNVFYYKVEVHDRKYNNVLHKNNNCLFEKFNIWSDIVFNYIKPQKKFEKCRKINDSKFYKIVDGVITVMNDDLYCFCSCVYSNGNNKLNSTKYFYINKSYKLDCDISHFRCYNLSGNIIFDDVYFYINRLNKFSKESTSFLEENFSIPINNKRYDVDIYVINSLSYYHTLRALPKTRKFLKEKLNGV